MLSLGLFAKPRFAGDVAADFGVLCWRHLVNDYRRMGQIGKWFFLGIYHPLFL